MALERECRVGEFMLGYADRLLADIPAEQMRARPLPNLNPPSWMLGHLAVVADRALGLLGRGAACPATWATAFKMGSDGASDPEPMPTKEELVQALRRGYGELFVALRSADEARLEQPHTSEFLRGSPLRTVGDVLAHITTSHLAMHLGQLSYWRRCTGYAAMF